MLIKRERFDGRGANLLLFYSNSKKNEKAKVNVVGMTGPWKVFWNGFIWRIEIH